MTSTLMIRDDALWARHIADAALRERVRKLPAGTPLRLVVDGKMILFRKMRDGSDGRPTPGLRADEEDLRGREAWLSLQARRGDVVSVQLVDEAGQKDPYLAYLDEFLWEWNTPEDAEAFDGL